MRRHPLSRRQPEGQHDYRLPRCRMCRTALGNLPQVDPSLGPHDLKKTKPDGADVIRRSNRQHPTMRQLTGTLMHRHNSSGGKKP